MRRGEGPKVELRFLISTKVISSPCFRTFLYEVIKCHFVSYFLHTFNLVFRISNFRNTPQVGIHSPNNFCVVPKSDVVFSESAPSNCSKRLYGRLVIACYRREVSDLWHDFLLVVYPCCPMSDTVRRSGAGYINSPDGSVPVTSPLLT